MSNKDKERYASFFKHVPKPFKRSSSSNNATFPKQKQAQQFHIKNNVLDDTRKFDGLRTESGSSIFSEQNDTSSVAPPPPMTDDVVRNNSFMQNGFKRTLYNCPNVRSRPPMQSPPNFIPKPVDHLTNDDPLIFRMNSPSSFSRRKSVDFAKEDPIIFRRNSHWPNPIRSRHFRSHSASPLRSPSRLAPTGSLSLLKGDFYRRTECTTESISPTHSITRFYETIVPRSSLKECNVGVNQFPQKTPIPKHASFATSNILKNPICPTLSATKNLLPHPQKLPKVCKPSTIDEMSFLENSTSNTEDEDDTTTTTTKDDESKREKEGKDDDEYDVDFSISDCSDCTTSKKDMPKVVNTHGDSDSKKPTFSKSGVSECRKAGIGDIPSVEEKPNKFFNEFTTPRLNIPVRDNFLVVSPTVSGMDVNNNHLSREFGPYGQVFTVAPARKSSSCTSTGCQAPCHKPARHGHAQTNQNYAYPRGYSNYQYGGGSNYDYSMDSTGYNDTYNNAYSPAYRDYYDYDNYGYDQSYENMPMSASVGSTRSNGRSGKTVINEVSSITERPDGGRDIYSEITTQYFEDDFVPLANSTMIGEDTSRGGLGASFYDANASSYGGGVNDSYSFMSQGSTIPAMRGNDTTYSLDNTYTPRSYRNKSFKTADGRKLSPPGSGGRASYGRPTPSKIPRYTGYGGVGRTGSTGYAGGGGAGYGGVGRTGSTGYAGGGGAGYGGLNTTYTVDRGGGSGGTYGVPSRGAGLNTTYTPPRRGAALNTTYTPPRGAGLNATYTRPRAAGLNTTYTLPRRGAATYAMPDANAWYGNANTTYGSDLNATYDVPGYTLPYYEGGAGNVSSISSPSWYGSGNTTYGSDMNATYDIPARYNSPGLNATYTIHEVPQHSFYPSDYLYDTVDIPEPVPINTTYDYPGGSALNETYVKSTKSNPMVKKKSSCCCASKRQRGGATPPLLEDSDSNRKPEKSSKIPIKTDSEKSRSISRPSTPINTQTNLEIEEKGDVEKTDPEKPESVVSSKQGSDGDAWKLCPSEASLQRIEDKEKEELLSSLSKWHEARRKTIKLRRKKEKTDTLQ